MLQLRKKILVSILTAAMVLSVGQSVVWSESTEAVPEDTTASEETASDTSADGEADAGTETEPAAEITDEMALASMKVYADNASFTLYVNEENGIFGLQNKSNGYVWWSNPVNLENDLIAKNAQKNDMRSSFIFNWGDLVDHRTTKVTSYNGAVDKGDMKLEQIENGMRMTYTFADTMITVPLEVTLKDKYLSVKVLTNQIVEGRNEQTAADNGAVMVDMSLFTNFGAGSIDEDGYLIVPDGSGAVINFNNQKYAYKEYSQKVYGWDAAVGQMKAPAKTEQASLPVVGIVKEDNALMAVVSEGDSYAIARAAVSQQKTTSYNSAWFDFQLRSTDNFYMGTGNTQLTSYEAGKIKIDEIEVRYYPIAGEDVSYVDVAQCYQQYLVEEKGLTKKTTANSSPFYLDIYGGTIKQQSVIGLPMNLETPATTYEQAQEIIKLLNDAGVTDMLVKYNEFNAAGITSRISSSVDYSGTLGGKAKFDLLKSYCDTNGIKLIPDVDLMEYERSGNGYSKTGNAAIRVTKAYATQQKFELAFGIPHQLRDTWVILSPDYFLDAYTKVADSFVKNGLDSISFNQGMSLLYSDFGNRQVSRQEALEILKNCYQTVKDKGLTLVAESANAYALPYVDYITDVPLYSSNFDLYDYDIPFYELVIHGYIPYTTKALNASSDAENLLLLSLATGSGIHYEMMYETPNDFTDCEYDELFYTAYSGWIQTASAQYKLAQDTIKSLSDKTITDYKFISATEIESTFSDGTTIYADLNNNILKVNGTEVNFANYGLGGEATNE